MDIYIYLFKEGRERAHLPHAREHLRDAARGDGHAQDDVGLVDPARGECAQAEHERRHAKAKKPSAVGVAMCDPGTLCEMWVLLMMLEGGMRVGWVRWSCL